MNRREMIKSSGAVLAGGISHRSVESLKPKSELLKEVERWDVFELVLEGTSAGNPFIDVWFTARFHKENRYISTSGFYDGDGVYKLRFMPDDIGLWEFETDSNDPSLKGKNGSVLCTPSKPGNHGPVSVRNSYHFGYADGGPYFPFGTTCYAWIHQTEDLQKQTLDSLREGPFNKIRMCIFPKWYQYNHGTPPRFPFPRNGEVNDYAHFNPTFFKHVEDRIMNLRAMNIEADLILFHPYDHWGFQEMPAEVDDRYLKYVIARFAAYRNVWWSLANEYDLLRKKTNSDWDRFARIITETDPYAHLRSIHYSHAPYDYSRVWCTHAGVQDYSFEKAPEWRLEWRKPVIFDECMYEGNINSRWGNLSGEEMTRRFWMAVIGGAYGGHGETFVNSNEVENDDAILWWSHGGTLKGKSPQRIAFLRKLLEELGSIGGGRIGFEAMTPTYYLSAKRNQDEVLLWYFDYHQPSYFTFPLPADVKFVAKWVDPWEMTITPLAGFFSGATRLDLPGHPYQAIVFSKV